MKGGYLSETQLLELAGDGVLVTDLSGPHGTGAGDFSLKCSGFWFEDGIVRYPVRGFALVGNFMELLGKVQGVGNDIEFSHLRTGGPSLLVSNLHIQGE